MAKRRVSKAEKKEEAKLSAELVQTPRNRLDWDTCKAERLAKQGVGVKDIAPLVGKHRTTVTRFLDSIGLDRYKIEAYRKCRATALTGTNALTHRVLTEVVNSITTEDIEMLKPAQRASMARDLSVVHGCLYDKERLERGESTVNVDMLLSDDALSKEIESLEAELSAEDAPVIDVTPADG